MNAGESIAWLETAIRHELAVASSWSLSGWPDCANHYRRNAAKAMRILKRVREVQHECDTRKSRSANRTFGKDFKDAGSLFGTVV